MVPPVRRVRTVASQDFEGILPPCPLGQSHLSNICGCHCELQVRGHAHMVCPGMDGAVRTPGCRDRGGTRPGSSPPTVPSSPAATPAKSTFTSPQRKTPPASSRAARRASPTPRSTAPSNRVRSAPPDPAPAPGSSARPRSGASSSPGGRRTPRPRRDAPNSSITLASLSSSWPNTPTPASVVNAVAVHPGDGGHRKFWRPRSSSMAQCC